MQNYQNTDFNHGFQSGLEGVKPDAYEQFLTNQVQAEWLESRIAEKQSLLQNINERLSALQHNALSVFEQLQYHTVQVSVANKKTERIKVQLFENQQEREQIASRVQDSRNHYSFVVGVLYLIAGFAFVFGDLIISHEIVAYALNIRNNFEAWAFAVGLAMIPVLLKPAYERLIEAPFVNNQNPWSKRIYVFFKVLLVIFSVATLVVLGWFRYEAYKTDRLKQTVNQQIKSLQSQSIDPLAQTPTLSPQVQQQIEAQMKAYDTLNQNLVNSDWALASFVLSGLLFALAGAVCLGIGFPVVGCYWTRWVQLNPAQKRLKKERTELFDALSDAEKILAEHVTQKEILENQYKQNAQVEGLETERKTLAESIEDLQSQWKLMATDSRTAAYNDGYAKGKEIAKSLTKDELEKYLREYLNKAKPADRTVPSRAPKRPHEWLRDAISDSFE
jgi:lipid A disaccharide synthetase